jgi:gag-polyprotein putative aspartyl protease
MAEAEMLYLRRLAFLVLFLSTTPIAAQSDFVPFRLQNGFLILVTGSIGPLPDLTFIVDTGAYRTVVDAAVAKNLGLAGRSDQVLAAGRSLPVERVELPALQFGPVLVTRLSALSMDLKAISSRFGVPIHAVVGLDILRSKSFLIDYKQTRIYFGQATVAGPVLAFDPTSPYLVVTLKIESEPVRLLVDTGADQISLFAHRVPSGLQKHSQMEASGTSAAGQVAARFFRASKVDYGAPRGRGKLVFIVPGDQDFIAYDGHLGVRSLGAARVYFDLAHNLMSWED